MESIGPFLLDSAFLEHGGLIRNDGYKKFCQENRGLVYRKRDFLFSGGTWRGEEQRAHIFEDEGIRSQILVTGHSGFQTRVTDQLVLRGFGVPKIFGTNLRPVRGYSSALPLGLTNYEENSHIHKTLSDESVWLEAVSNVEACYRWQPKLYINMTIGNNQRARGSMLKAAYSSQLKILREEPKVSRDGWLSYLMQMRQSPLTACPEGTGVDTHRLWECLYVGGTPVVTSHPIMNHLYEQLPVIVLNSWRELSDLKRLQKLWHESREKPWRKEVLSLSYWTTKIILPSGRSII